jgi:RNA polymerase sigma-70 factor (ECF subfamily)
MAARQPASDLATVTSTSLLAGLRDPSNDAAWEAYVERYRPMIVAYAARVGVPRSEAEDVAQTALLEFCTALRRGGYDRDRGRLRTWLFGIVANQVRRWRERVRPRDLPTADAPDARAVLQAAEAREDAEGAWEDEWRQAVLRQCLEEVRREVEPTTFAAFERFAMQGRPAGEVARELGLSANAVFGAKRRVLERVRDRLPMIEEIW